MRRNRLALVAAAAILLATGCVAVPAASVKQQMTAVDKASAVLFSVAGEVDPANGPDQPPVPAARWRAAADAARTLQTVGKAMQAPAHARDNGPWMTLAKEMTDLSAAALAAANGRNAADLATASNALSDNCTACHTPYKPKL